MAYAIGYLIGSSIGAIIGAICGLLPMIVGNQKKQQTLGSIGLGFCVASGITLGLILAAPVAALFTWRILQLDKMKICK